MTTSMMKAIGATVRNSGLFCDRKSINITSEKKRRFFVGLAGFESCNDTCEFVRIGFDELDCGYFGEILFDELRCLILFKANLRNLMKVLVQSNDFAIHFFK